MPSPAAAPSADRSTPVCSPFGIAELPIWKRLTRLVSDHRQWLEQVQIDLTRVPAPTFHEKARAAFIADRFREIGLQDVRLDEAGNVLAERPGRNSRWLAITAHLDTVFPPETSIEVRRSNGRIYAPGITDNGAGLAAMLGTASILQQSDAATDLSLLFAANVGEEGEGDLYGMRHLLAHTETRRRIAAMLILDGSSVEHITVAGLGSRRYLVELRGPGGHSWKDFGRVNPLHALAHAISELSRLPLPSDPRTVMNFGALQGGAAVNSIPQAAWLKVDIRSARVEGIERCSQALLAAMRAAVEQENKRGSGTLSMNIRIIGERPAAQLAPGSRLLAAVRDTDRLLGISSRLECASTDANIPLSLGMEAVAIAGGGSGGDAHTPQEWYDPRGRDLGVKRIVLATLASAGLFDSPLPLPEIDLSGSQKGSFPSTIEAG